MNKLNDFWSHIKKIMPRFENKRIVLLILILKIVGLLLLVGLFSFGVGFFGFEWFIKPKISEKSTTFDVPDVRYKSLQQAEQIAEQEELTLVVREHVYDSQASEGYVIGQDPLPGLSAAEDRTLYVVVSKGTEIITIPDLAGMSLRQARILLARNSLTVGHISYTYVDLKAKDIVITQSPLVGTQVSRGMVVDLLVSMGQRKSEVGYVMPDLSGRNYDEVQFWLERWGLRVGISREVHDDFLLPGTILEQSPDAGIFVERGENVLLTVSRVSQSNFN